MNAKSKFTKIGFLLLMATVLLNGSNILFSALLDGHDSILANPTLTFLLGMLPIYLVVYPVTFIAFRKVPADSFEEKKRLTFPEGLKLFCIGYLFIYGGNLVASVLVGIISAVKQTPVQNGILNIVTNVNPVLNFVIICICAPIAEEFLFRKLLMDRTLRYGERLSILFSAVMFGLFHGNLQQIVYAIPLGLVLAYVYAKTKNVFYTMLLHFCINLPGSVIAPLVMDKSGYLEWMEGLGAQPSQEEMMRTMLAHMDGILLFFGYSLLLFGVAIAGFVLLIVNCRKITFVQAEEPVEKGLKTAFLNPGVLLFVLLNLALVIWQLVM